MAEALCAILYFFFSLVCNSPQTFAFNEDLFSFNATDDISRVKLSVQTHSTDDYVNANYIPVSGLCLHSTGCWDKIFRAPLSVSVT